MDIGRELLKIEKEIMSRYEIFKTIQRSSKTLLNLNNDLDVISKRLDNMAALCLSQRRKGLYEEYIRIYRLYKSIIKKIENDYYIDKNETIVEKKQPVEDVIKNSKNEFRGNDGGIIEIKKISNYNKEDYNFTNRPPEINKYEVKHKYNINDQEVILKHDNVFSYLIDEDKFNNSEIYRDKIINGLLTVNNINKAYEDYRGNVSDSFRGDYTNTDRYTPILATEQMRNSFYFKRTDETRLYLLPVGEMTIEGKGKVQQYLYHSFIKDYKGGKTGYVFGNIDLERMKKDEQYKKVVLNELEYERTGENIFLGDVIENTNGNIEVSQDNETLLVLEKLGLTHELPEYLL